MSFATPESNSPALQPTPPYYTSTPPVPPPKPSTSSTPINRGPPPPPLPVGHVHHEVSELDGNPSAQSHEHYFPQGQAQIQIPAIQHDWLPESLKDKSTADLHHLLESRDLQGALLNDASTTHPALPASQAALQPLVESNVSLAESLLSLEARLTQQREQTQSRLLALRALEQQHRAKIAETEDALRAFSPMALYQRLNASAQEQHQLVQGIEESWLDESGVASDREIGDFVRRVKDGKKLAFLRTERKRSAAGGEKCGIEFRRSEVSTPYQVISPASFDKLRRSLRDLVWTCAIWRIQDS
ncbi:hypothetical protein LTR95_000105 [Oleoguttula sp. CCFEE 5521]